MYRASPHSIVIKCSSINTATLIAKSVAPGFSPPGQVVNHIEVRRRECKSPVDDDAQIFLVSKIKKEEK